MKRGEDEIEDEAGDKYFFIQYFLGALKLVFTIESPCTEFNKMSDNEAEKGNGKCRGRTRGE